MKILVCGSRTWKDVLWIARAMTPYRMYYQNLSWVMGDCPTGADRLALEHASTNGDRIEFFKADWTRYKLRAGPLRNQAMIDVGPDLVLAFLDTGSPSPGTKDTIRRARKAGIPLVIHERRQG